MFSGSNYLIKEQFKFLKLIDRYDIYEPESGDLVAYAKENISGGLKFLRLLVNKTLLPTTVEIVDVKNEQVLYTMKRPVTFLRSKVSIFDKDLNSLGYFKSRIFTLGGRFDIFGADGNKLAEVKGNWTGWNFKMTDINGNEIGLVTKKWSGLGKELFTTADNYMISINDTVKGDEGLMVLLIMAGIAVDIVYKEKK